MSKIKNRHVYSAPTRSFLPSDLICESATPMDTASMPAPQRSDGRGDDEVRPIFIKLGLVSDCSGSAYVEQGGTKVMCTVYGPRDLAAAAPSGGGYQPQQRSVATSNPDTNSHLSCSVKFAPYATNIRASTQPGPTGNSDFDSDRLSSNYDYMLLDALKPVVTLSAYDKVQINVHLLVIEDDGSLLAASVTCASLALAHAGIEMEDIILGSTLLYHRATGDTPSGSSSDDVRFFLDPSGKEESEITASSGDSQCGSVTLALMPAKDRVATLQQTGTSIGMDTIARALDVLTQTCVRYYPVVKDTLLQYVSMKIKETDV